MEWVYYEKEKKSEGKKDKWESIRYKQANNIYSAKIKNRMMGTLRPRARIGRWQNNMPQRVSQLLVALQPG